MPVEDISDVTRSLLRLLEFNLERLTGQNIEISSVRPNDVSAARLKVNCYLYHMRLDPFALSPSMPPKSPLPLLQTPTRVILYYIITTSSNNSPGDSLHNEERLLGLVLKTLRDNTRITDDTNIDGTALLHPEITGMGNDFTIHLTNGDESTASNFWAAENTGGVQPSVYCEMRNVELLAEQETTSTLPVLSLGMAVQPNFGPTLRLIRSRMQFEAPSEGGIDLRILNNTLARVMIGAASISNELSLQLTGEGTTGNFILKFPERDDDLNDQDTEFAIEPAAQNGDWHFEQKEGEFIIGFGSSLNTQEGGASVATPLSPGLYQLLYETEVEFQHKDGSSKQKSISNALNLHLCPLINSANYNAPHWQFTLAGDYTLDIDQPENHLSLAFDQIRYQFSDQPDVLNEGEFAIADEAMRVIRFRPLAYATSVGWHALQFWVFEQAAQPYWLEMVE